MRFILLILIVLARLVVAHAQNAPITTAATLNSPEPGSIIVPITVTNFQDIGAISLSLDYDYSVLNYVGGTPNPAFPGWFIINDNNLGDGFHRLIMGWFGSGVSLPDSSSIMDIEFTYISGTTSLAWYDIGGSCEYADVDNQILNDMPTSDYYINGNVCGAIGTPGSITGDSTVCQLESAVFYSTDTIANATAYAWTVPAGASIN